MKNLLTFITAFFIATTLFAQKNMHENARYKNLPEKDILINYHENDMMHKQLSEREREHLRELKKNSRKTTYKGKANEQDSLALVALYNATDGDNWTNNTNWLTGNVADWYGILLDGNGRVTRILLLYNQLTGSIPAEIDSLTSLTELYLAHNQITGSIPAEIGNLTNLTVLWLQVNQLTGSIPTEIGNLTSLTEFYLYDNQLTGSIPTEIGSLTSLTHLYLQSNQLAGSIPAEIGNLTNLTNLYLTGIQLTGSIPVEIGNLTSLQYLYLDANQLSGNIPTEIGNLTSLTELDLGYNQLSGTIPAEIGNLTSLTSLCLYFNQLSGSIPTEINNLTSLSMLFLNDNQFEDLSDLSALTYLDYLYINSNKFTFEDIEPNIDVGDNFYYSPQAKIGNVEHYTPNAGDNLDLTVITGGTANTYQWYKDNVAISGAVSSTYSIINYNSGDDAGIYMCKIDNTIATALTLESRNIYIGTDVTTFEISATANPIESGTITGTGTYNDGATATLTATPETGYNFVKWTEDDITVSVDAVYIFNVGEDRTLIANFESTVSISELENKISFTVYPNPARNLVNIQLNNIEDNNIQLNMYDFYGRKININTDKFHTGIIQINISDKSAGIYYLQIISAGKFSETIKLIITK
ncbi:MAG: leucine-rich repeat domain-containing protein [Bacteroidales bacterium]|nr:leucine-rich repeat domain-containing protein [Bacteroidales bacterium]